MASFYRAVFLVKLTLVGEKDLATVLYVSFVIWEVLWECAGLCVFVKLSLYARRRKNLLSRT